MNDILPDRVLREIKKTAAKNDIARVILFGSRARGTHSEKSDVDIAAAGGRFDEFYWEIKENLHSLLTFDVVDFDAASDELKNEIIRDGVVIYEKT